MTIDNQVLRAFSPFENLNDEYLARVRERVELRQVEKGTLIFKRGKNLDEALYLINGQVDLIDAQFSIESLTPGLDQCRYPLSGSSPTQVSAVAKTDVTLASLERDFLDLVMAWSQSADKEEGDEDEYDWMSSLLESPLFTQVPPGNIQQLFVRFESVAVAKGETVVREGEPGDYFYVIESGRARVLDKAGKLLASLVPGQFFGEEALVGDTTRNATVNMSSSGSLMRLSKEDFKTLLQEPVMRLVDFETLKNRGAESRACQLVDVRLPVERRFAKVPDSINIPLSTLRRELEGLDHGVCYVVTDDAGRRSDVAAQLLAQAGFETLILQNADQHYSG